MPEDAIKDLANRPLEKFSAEGTKYASMIVASLPVIILYPFVQKYFVTGIKIGAIKG
jgi:ABC-type glycerol-3-phosphate transport system permease component